MYTNHVKINAKKVAAETGKSIIVLNRTTSTFEDSERNPDSVIVALYQTGGHGKGERKFASPRGGLYVNFNFPLSDYGAITPKIGLAVMNAVRRLGFDARVKWLNDVYLNGRKICGILCKRKGNRILAGLGVNFSTDPRDLTEVPNAGSLKADPKRADDFLISLINNVYACLDAPFDPSVYQENCITIGRLVDFLSNDNVQTCGTAIGVTHNGELIVQSQSGTETVSSGDVNLQDELPR